MDPGLSSAEKNASLHGLRFAFAVQNALCTEDSYSSTVQKGM